MDQLGMCGPWKKLIGEYFLKIPISPTSGNCEAREGHHQHDFRDFEQASPIQNRARPLGPIHIPEFAFTRPCIMQHDVRPAGEPIPSTGHCGGGGKIQEWRVCRLRSADVAAGHLGTGQAGAGLSLSTLAPSLGVLTVSMQPTQAKK